MHVAYRSIDCVIWAEDTQEKLNNRLYKLLTSLENKIKDLDKDEGIQGDQREDHDSGRTVTIDELSKLGVIYRSCPSISSVDAIAAERSYKNRDQITVSPGSMGSAYEDKVKIFFIEHLHEDEEIRYILDGQGFFDVRDCEDSWIRIRVEKDDLIILPAGLYHRFTTDTRNFITAMRLFKDEPRWTPLNRDSSLDDNAFRKTYLDTLDSKSRMT